MQLGLHTQAAFELDDPALYVDQDPELVLRNAGPKGDPGMPEWGQRQAHEGCDFDFLEGTAPIAEPEIR